MAQTVGTCSGSEPARSVANTRDGLTRLIKKQEEEIDLISKRIELWQKYRSDYKELNKLIDQMSEKVRYPYKIPIAGSHMAYVDGHIIHTNELTVLLGDNLFALRSTKQANQMIKRRLNNIEDMLKKSNDTKTKTQQWLEAVNVHKRDKEEFVEIIETM